MSGPLSRIRNLTPSQSPATEEDGLMAETMAATDQSIAPSRQDLADDQADADEEAAWAGYETDTEAEAERLVEHE